MKKLSVLILFCIALAQANSQTLFTYGSNAVTRDEFLKAYNKNKTPVADKEKALREYLELYTRFKLKVKVAESLRLDTIQQLKFDMQNFRSQVEEGYLNDEKGVNTLLDEVLERIRKDIHLLHFSAPINAGMPAADTAKLYGSMEALAAEIRGGPADIKKLQAKYPAIKIKDLGYITALSLPYEMENRVYALRPGEVSKPYRTKSTLHVFKNEYERKSAGKWTIAQILFSLPPGASDTEVKATEKRADSVYQLLMNGGDFKELAKQYSDDKITYLNGGELPEFGTGKFAAPFETTVFQLEKDGDISRPILTEYGFHIVKRLGQRDLPEGKSDEAYIASLKQQIIQDSRINKVKEFFLKDIQVKTGYKRNPLVTDNEWFRFADSVSTTGTVGAFPFNKKTIIHFKNATLKGAAWLNFIKDYKLNRDVYKGETNKELQEKFISTSTYDYYRKHLEEYNKEFKYQMQEFREGNMLFEIMERNVWSKASNDSIGLKKFYNLHKDKYKWGESADILLFNCTDEKVATDAIVALEKGKNWRQLAEESDGTIQSDSGRYELNQLQLPAGVSLSAGIITRPQVNSGDNTTSFIKVLRLFPANQQRTYEEARGLVINDYQAYLEEQWIAALKRKFPVKINEPVFQSLLQ
jgi:peptidyl-prolyl cis-trans isomerase SurA